VSTSSDQLSAQPAPRPWPLSPEPEPVFGLLEVAGAFVGLFVAILFCGAIALVVAHHLDAFSNLPMLALGEDPRVILPAQLAAYLLVFGLLARLFSYHRMGFLSALSWHWPLRWPLFLVGGVLLALAAAGVSHFLPQPTDLPIDKMMRNASNAWLLTAFGVLIAPFAEEVLFRGLLFPALTRRIGVLLSLIATSVFFGVVHAQQLAGAWIQIACIVVVGFALTLVRWRFRSLASSTLVHVGYNGTLFATLFLQTHGFTNFSVH
jgi:uncharacterized protein